MTVKCDCHRHYADEKGVELCRDNDHADGKDVYGKRMAFKHTLEPEITIACGECSTPLKGYLRIDGLNIEVNVVPHICAVEEK
jgi:hypothetical protein